MGLRQCEFDVTAIWDASDGGPPRSDATASNEESVRRLKAAAFISSLKGGRKAVRRCRNRVRRMVSKITSGASDAAAPDDAGPLILAALAEVRRECSVCRKCEGP